MKLRSILTILFLSALFSTPLIAESSEPASASRKTNKTSVKSINNLNDNLTAQTNELKSLVSDELDDLKGKLDESIAALNSINEFTQSNSARLSSEQLFCIWAFDATYLFSCYKSSDPSSKNDMKLKDIVKDGWHLTSYLGDSDVNYITPFKRRSFVVFSRYE